MRVLFLLGLMVCATQASNSVLIKLLAKFRIGNCKGDCPCNNSTNSLQAAEAKLAQLESAVTGLENSLNQANAANSSVDNAQAVVDDLKSSINGTSPTGRFRRGTDTVSFTSCEDSTKTLNGSVGNVTLTVLDGIIAAVQTISTTFQVTKLNCYTNIAHNIDQGLRGGSYNVPSNAADLLIKANVASAKANQAKSNIENAINNLKVNLAQKKAELEAQKAVVQNLGGTVPGDSSFLNSVIPDSQMIDKIPPVIPVTNPTAELISTNPSSYLFISKASDPPDKQETPVPVSYSSQSTVKSTGNSLIYKTTTENVLQPGWSLMFLIDNQHLQFTPENYSTCITAIWDAITLRKDQNLSVSVMLDDLIYTNVDPEEKDICQIYRQLESLSMAFPILSLPYKQPSMISSVLYIITGNQSLDVYKPWTHFLSDFNTVCYVLVDDTETYSYDNLVTNTSNGPCIISLSQLPYHLLDTEEYHPKSQPQCKNVGNICFTNEECGSIAMICQDGKCIHPECSNKLDSLSVNESSGTSLASPAGCCPPDQFLCHELPLRCIPRIALCDTTFDCLTGEDEHPLTCEKYECPNARLKCSSYQCVQPQQKCDGIHQCMDGSDEEGCQI